VAVVLVLAVVVGIGSDPIDLSSQTILHVATHGPSSGTTTIAG
jgi:hypothetical protein